MRITPGSASRRIGMNVTLRHHRAPPLAPAWQEAEKPPAPLAPMLETRGLRDGAMSLLRQKRIAPAKNQREKRTRCMLDWRRHANGRCARRRRYAGAHARHIQHTALLRHGRNRSHRRNALAYALRRLRCTRRRAMRKMPQRPALHRLVARMPPLRCAIRARAVHRVQPRGAHSLGARTAPPRRLRQRCGVRRRPSTHCPNLQGPRRTTACRRHRPHHDANGSTRVAHRHDHVRSRFRCSGSQTRVRPCRAFVDKAGAPAERPLHSHPRTPANARSEIPFSTRPLAEHGRTVLDDSRKQPAPKAFARRRRAHHGSDALRCHRRSQARRSP